MCVTRKTTEKLGYALVDHGVVADSIFEFRFFVGGRELAIEEQITGLEKVRLLGQLLDWIAAMQQNTSCAINIGNFGFTGRRGDETWVVGENSLGYESAHINYIGTSTPCIDG